MSKKHINSTMSQYWSKNPILVKTSLGRGVSFAFSWQVDKAKDLAKREGIDLIGGPGAILSGLTVPDIDDSIIEQHNPYATFTTRGCVNSCSFCAVPKIEGEFRELQGWNPNPLICDNNILAASQSHFTKAIDSVIKFGWVDFNQGLDCRLVTDFHFDQLRRVKKVILRFSFDSIAIESKYMDAIRAKEYGFRDIRSYVLIGFNDTPEDALYRLELCRKLGVLTNPMRYQPIDTKVKNSYINPAWTDYELKRMMRYWANLRITYKIPYKDFDPGLTSKKKIKREVKMEDVTVVLEKCPKHSNVSKVPSKKNPNRLYCPECIKKRSEKAVKTRKENQKKIEKPKKEVFKEIKLSFDKYPSLLDELSKSAEQEDRTIELEIIHRLKTSFPKSE
jgi:hypothetical protein